MIDLDRTKAQMLAEINASEKAWANRVSDLTAPEFVTLDEAFLVVRGSTPDDFLSGLNAALAARFASVPPEKLIRDLYYPLKKGLGNAYKWGNRKDPDKQLTVEVVVTKTGAFVAIADEGAGFDVNGILRRFQDGEQYFSHGGSGFVHFNRAQSVISYADGGRTLLIRFLCAPEPVETSAAGNAAIRMAGNAPFMKSLLAAELPYFRKNKATLDSCRIYMPAEHEDDQPDVKYVLEYHKGKSEETKTATMTGRLLPESAAQIDFSVAGQLYKGPLKGKTGIQIPKPLAVFKEPSLVLFKFNPAKDLRDYLKKIFDFPTLVKVITMIAVALFALHQSPLALDAAEDWDDIFERRQAAKRRIDAKLAQASPQRAERFNRFFNHLEERATTLKSCEQVPIHGAFRWDSILYGDEKFYFYRFEECQRSHPGFDVGSFLADMRRFYLLRRKADQSFYYAGREVFLEAYFAGDLPAWREDVPFFVASAMLLRLDRLLERPQEKWEEKVDAFLEQCEQIIRET